MCYSTNHRRISDFQVWNNNNICSKLWKREDASINLKIEQFPWHKAFCRKEQHTISQICFHHLWEMLCGENLSCYTQTGKLVVYSQDQKQQGAYHQHLVQHQWFFVAESGHCLLNHWHWPGYQWPFPLCPAGLSQHSLLAIPAAPPCLLLWHWEPLLINNYFKEQAARASLPTSGSTMQSVFIHPHQVQTDKYTESPVWPQPEQVWQKIRLWCVLSSDQVW